MNDRSKTVESRFLFAAMICAVLPIVDYFALVGTPWGHQFDDDAFLARKALRRKVITLDSDLLKLLRKRTFFLGVTATLAVAVMRRCTIAGVIAVAAFGCAAVGAEVLKHVPKWHMLVPNDAMLESDFQTNTYPSGHATVVTSFCIELAFGLAVALATVVGYSRRLHQRNACDRCPCLSAGIVHLTHWEHLHGRGFA